jgi:hypothetical protein
MRNSAKSRLIFECRVFLIIDIMKRCYYGWRRVAPLPMMSPSPDTCESERKVTVKCELCNREFDARKRKFIFIKRPDLVGRESILGPSLLTRRRHYCSQLYLERVKAGWVPSECQNCGAKFPGKAYPNNAALWRSPLFCSVACEKLLVLRV